MFNGKVGLGRIFEEEKDVDDDEEEEEGKWAMPFTFFSLKWMRVPMYL